MTYFTIYEEMMRCLPDKSRRVADMALLLLPVRQPLALVLMPGPMERTLRLLVRLGSVRDKAVLLPPVEFRLLGSTLGVRKVLLLSFFLRKLLLCAGLYFDISKYFG